MYAVNMNQTRIKMAGKLYNLIHYKIGRLTVVSENVQKYLESRKKNRYWNCMCTCGNIVTVSTGHLRDGSTQSCGCFYKENLASIHKECVVDTALRVY